MRQKSKFGGWGNTGKGGSFRRSDGLIIARSHGEPVKYNNVIEGRAPTWQYPRDLGESQEFTSSQISNVLNKDDETGKLNINFQAIQKSIDHVPGSHLKTEFYLPVQRIVKQGGFRKIKTDLQLIGSYHFDLSGDTPVLKHMSSIKDWDMIKGLKTESDDEKVIQALYSDFVDSSLPGIDIGEEYKKMGAISNFIMTNMLISNTNYGISDFDITKESHVPLLKDRSIIDRFARGLKWFSGVKKQKNGNIRFTQDNKKIKTFYISKRYKQPENKFKGGLQAESYFSKPRELRPGVVGTGDQQDKTDLPLAA